MYRLPSLILRVGGVYSTVGEQPTTLSQFTICHDVYALVGATAYESTTSVVDRSRLHSFNKSYHYVSRTLYICHDVYALVVAQCKYRVFFTLAWYCLHSSPRCLVPVYSRSTRVIYLVSLHSPSLTTSTVASAPKRTSGRRLSYIGYVVCSPVSIRLTRTGLTTLSHGWTLVS